MWKKTLAVVMAGVAACSMVACGGGGDSGGGAQADTTVIAIANYELGVGRAWLDAATKRFSEKAKNLSYQEGKTGVSFEIQVGSVNSSTMNTSANHIFFDEANSDVRTLAQKGYLMDISDIVTEKLTEYNENKTIEDKIDVNYRQMLKGNDGKYYGLPNTEWYPGVVYDVETFTNYGLYLAAPDAVDSTTWSCNYGTAKFVGKGADNEFGTADDGKKSCGNDGEYGTADDGLPTTLVEFLVLCDYMSKRGVTPITMSGAYELYGNYLIEGLWASLAGAEGMATNFTFDGELEVVDGWTEEPLFDGISYIKKPTTKKVDVTEATGYYARDAVARYYATAMLEIIQKEGWFSEDASNSNISHTDTQGNFIFGEHADNAKAIGMMIEGSYWYIESVNCGNFEDYYGATEKSERNLAWMSLPTSLNQPVTAGNGRESVMLETAIAYGFINANIKDEGLKQACKDFLQFLYTDESLREFTVVSGTPKAVSYTMTDADKAKLDAFPLSVWNAKENGTVVYCGGQTNTFLTQATSFRLYSGAGIFDPEIDGTVFQEVINAIRQNKTAKQCFEATRWTAQYWTSVLYKGE